MNVWFSLVSWHINYYWLLIAKSCFYIQGAKAKLGIFKYNNKQLYDKTRLILILKNKQQNKKKDTKQWIHSIWPQFFSIIVLTHLSKWFKINSSDILFHSSSIVVLSEPIFRWEVAFVLFSKMPHIA